MKDKSKTKKNKTKKKKKELDIEVKDAAQVKEGDLDDKQIVIINNIQPPDSEMPELRTMSLYGDITEQKRL